MIKFWWLSESRIRITIRIRIATLVRRVLVEVCTVPLLLVLISTILSGRHLLTLLLVSVTYSVVLAVASPLRPLLTFLID